MWEPLSAWMAALLMVSALSGSTTRSRVPTEHRDAVCARLVEHVGVKQVAKRDKSRPDDDPGFSEVCMRVELEARRQDLDPEIAVAVAYGESGMRWSPQASKRFIGPMQVGRRWCKAPVQGCIPDGVGYLVRWRAKSSSWREALWGYVGGDTRGLSAKQRARKRKHVKRVQDLVEALKKKR